MSDISGTIGLFEPCYYEAQLPRSHQSHKWKWVHQLVKKREPTEEEACTLVELRASGEHELAQSFELDWGLFEYEWRRL